MNCAAVDTTSGAIATGRTAAGTTVVAEVTGTPATATWAGGGRRDRVVLTQRRVVVGSGGSSPAPKYLNAAPTCSRVSTDSSRNHVGCQEGHSGRDGCRRKSPGAAGKTGGTDNSARLGRPEPRWVDAMRARVSFSNDLGPMWGARCPSGLRRPGHRCRTRRGGRDVEGGRARSAGWADVLSGRECLATGDSARSSGRLLA